jgi:protein-S-isoprenylcysteine O-methyltransferase Ste14
VIKGPYRFVRNPMYLGAGLALAGTALFSGSWQIIGYAAVLGLMLHLFIVLYEEPRLRKTFSRDYAEYCNNVHRWVPLFRIKNTN